MERIENKKRKEKMEKVYSANLMIMWSCNPQSRLKFDLEKLKEI